MSEYYDEDTGRYRNIKEGMLIKSWRGVNDEVFFIATHWDKSKPLLSSENDPMFQYLQVTDCQTGEHYWLRSYPVWSVMGMLE